MPMPLPLLLLGACAAPTPLINEIMADNASTVADITGDWADWIELCNPDALPLALGGYALSDTPDDPSLSPLPASWAIPADGHLLLWATGTADEDAFSLPFKISADGETVGLFLEEDGAMVEIDRVTFGPQDPDTSVARSPDCGDGWVRSESPTPSAPNP